MDRYTNRDRYGNGNRDRDKNRNTNRKRNQPREKEIRQSQQFTKKAEMKGISWKKNHGAES